MNKVANILAFVLFIVIFISSSSDIDWNEEQIKWYGYNEGISEAKRLNKSVVIVVYADWCGYCEEYSRHFMDHEIEHAMEKVVAIKLDHDDFDGWEKEKGLYATGVPRTYGLDRHGKFIKNAGRRKKGNEYFYWTKDKQKLLKFINLVASK